MTDSLVVFLDTSTDLSLGLIDTQHASQCGCEKRTFSNLIHLTGVNFLVLCKKYSKQLQYCRLLDI